MSIRGKKEGCCRLIGSFLLLLSFILSIFFSILALDEAILSLILIFIIIPPFLMSILLKLEQAFVVNNSTKLLILLAILVVVLNSVTLPINSDLLKTRFVLLESSNLLLISCWHFSLSIYKRDKLIFVISGISSFILNIFLWFILKHLFIINIFLILTLFLGLFLITSAELMMKKKGLLNYI